MKGWQEQAKCKSLPTIEKDKLFFPNVTSINPHVQEFCNGCIVRTECLNYGVLYKEEGYWGGLNLKQRLEIRPRLLSYLQSAALKEGPLESRNLDEFIGMIDGVQTIQSIPDLPEDLLDKVERLLSNYQGFVLNLILPVPKSPT